MEDVCLFKEGWKWVKSKRICYLATGTYAICLRDKIGLFMDLHWPVVCNGCARFRIVLLVMLIYWRDCVVKGVQSLFTLGSVALLVIMWSCFLSLTSMSCLGYLLLSMGVAGGAIRYLGHTPGIIIVGLYAILVLWMYANFWITGALFIFGGCLFSLNHARCVVLIATAYTIYSVHYQVGWLGVFLSINLAFLSDDAFHYLLQWCDKSSESIHVEELKKSKIFMEENISEESEYSVPVEEADKPKPTKINSRKAATQSSMNKQTQVDSKRQVVKEDTNSISEMTRILSCKDHYDALQVIRHINIDAIFLKREYRKKAMLVHPDKNMGSPQASESFKKLQCAYEVLSDSVKKRDYDDQLRREEAESVSQKSQNASHQDDPHYSEESRCIQCTKCGNPHIWVRTKRTKAKARWCQDCCQYHQAKDGDGWVEYKGSLGCDRQQKVEIPRAFVCAESKIFDVSEWAICQGMACRPNSHRPSFHVNMVGLEKSAQRSNSSRYPWDFDDEMTDEEVEFELWLQKAVASGLFCETPKRRKSWGPFKLNQSKTNKQWRRTSQ